jgi:N-acetylglutamate synthase-like GNAT family acetyltransferase
MPELSFRAATASDIPALVQLVTRAYRGEESRQGWTSEADLLGGERIVPAVLLEDIRRIDSLVIVAELGGELVGCAHIERVNETTGYFGMFAVSPTLQGQGTGRLILAEAERQMVAEWQLTESQMTVLDARAELLAFYERRGYTRTGVYRPFPYGDERFGIPARTDLRLEVLTRSLGGPLRPEPPAPRKV